MKYKLLTFLGTTKYTTAYFEWENKEEDVVCRTGDPYPFVQMGILEFFRTMYGEEPLEVVVFLTDEAREKNWEVREEKYKGLRWYLEEEGKELAPELTVREIPIKTPQTEEELWELFETINGTLGENDRVIFDITHSFRFFPVLTMLVLNYARFVKKVDIIHILYGAMEALGTREEIEQMYLEDRNVPLWDFSPMIILLDWTYAIEKFLETGNADALEETVKKDENFRNLLAKTRGRKGGALDTMVKSLSDFTRHIYTCRMPKIGERLETVIKRTELAKLQEDYLPVMKPVIERVNQRFKGMYTSNPTLTELKIAEWCAEKGLIQQGYTFLREALVNYILRSIPEVSLTGKEDRKKAENILNGVEIPPVSIPYLEDIKKVWMKVADIRNDINHGGMRTWKCSPNTLIEQLQNFVHETMEILEGKEKIEEEKDKNSILGS